MSRRDVRWQRLGLSRRGFLGTAALSGGALAAIAAGCSSSTKPASNAPANSATGPGAAGSPAAQQPKKGGTIIDSRFQVITGRTMDPAIETPTSNKERRVWYQGLLGYSQVTLDLQPELAQKWEQPDQTTFVFHLQQNVKWHNKPPANGRAFTADDAVFGLNHVRTKDPRFINASLLDSVDQITAPDQATVRVTATKPDAVLLAKLSSDGTLLLNPEVVAKAQKFATAEECVGTGAFVMKTLQDQVGASSVRNPDYWKPGQPYMDGFEYRYFGDNQQAYAALQAKQVDLVYLQGDQNKDYISHKPKGYVPKLFKDSVGTVWLMPNVRIKPFDDARLPRALRLLADYQELRDGHGKVWYADCGYASVLPASLSKWDFSQDEYSKMIFWQQPKDAAVKQALDLLSAAGYSKDKPLTFDWPIQVNSGDQVTPALAQLIQAEWKKFSQGAVDAQIKVFDGAQSTQARAQNSFSYGLFAAAGAFDDPDPWLTQILRTKGSRNYTGFSDPEIDGLIDKQGATFDLAQRQGADQAGAATADRSQPHGDAAGRLLPVRHHRPRAQPATGGQHHLRRPVRPGLARYLTAVGLPVHGFPAAARGHAP